MYPRNNFHIVFYFIDNSSNYGKRFVLGFTQQNDHTGYIQISIVAKCDANVTITALTSSRPLFTFHIKAGMVMQYKLSTSFRMQGITTGRKGVEVNATEDITVFCLNHVSYISDGYLAFQ